MHPSMIGLLARQCESELRRSAFRHVLHVPRRRRSVRHRAGWALAALGLTLAAGQAMPDTQPGATGAMTRCACRAPAMGGWPRR
jgi:hypothetical protein